MINNDFKIDFIGIGASRSGSTWISQCLKEHPQICFSRKKEIHFFSNPEKYKKGLKYYASFFKKCDDLIKGEFTPQYLTNPESAALIKKHFPNVKLIACLRNPIDRLYSQYYFDLAREKTNYKNFEDYLRDKKTKRNIKKGCYYSGLKKYFEIFPKEKILVLLYDDLKKNPINFVSKVYEFLEVDSNFIPPNINKKTNASTLKNKLVFVPFVNKIIKIGIEKNDNCFLGFIKKIIKITGLNRVIFFLYNLNKNKVAVQKQEKPKINEDTKKRLFGVYEEEINNLEKLINRDLNIWKKI